MSVRHIGLSLALLLSLHSLPARADDAVFRNGSSTADGQQVNCYTNTGAERFRKNIRMGSDGSIYNVIPPPPKPVPKVIPLKGATAILSYEESANQTLASRFVPYFVWDKLERHYNTGMVNLSELICTQAKEQGLDPLIVELIIKHESNFDSHALSRSGAQGLMQLMPNTAAGLGVRDAFDPAENVTAGTRYFAEQYRRFGDLHRALAAYNAGPTTVEQANGVPPIPETVDYVNAIAGEYESLKKKK